MKEIRWYWLLRRYRVAALEGARADELSFAAGKALKDAGWKEEVLTADAMIGEITFTKEKQELSLSYVDTGVMPAEFTIKGTRVEVEKADRKD